MASASSLNAAAVIINGGGLSYNGQLIAEIAAFQALGTVTTVASIFSSAKAFEANIIANDGGVLLTTLSSLGTTANQGQWLIDLWPVNGNPAYGRPNGYIPQISATYNAPEALPEYGSSINSTSYSSAIRAQAMLPFQFGMAGFANVFTSSYGFAMSVYDTVGSIHMLTNKTIGQTGVGYTSQIDLITGGVGTNGPLLANVVSTWGTMYDVTKLNNFYDPHVFGQNLLNQGLGTVGNLKSQLAATGLDTDDITVILPSSTVTTPVSSTILSNSPVGQTQLPGVVANVTTTTVSGNNPNTVTAIYSTITGSNLATFTSTTNFTSNVTISSLADLLDINKAVPVNLLNELNGIGVRSFSDFGNVLHKAVGQGTFNDWASVAKLLNAIQVPKLTTAVSHTPNTVILSSSTISTMNNVTNGGVGSGAFNNPVMLDFLGAASGTPYIGVFQTLINSYPTLSSTVSSSLSALNSAVASYITAYQANLAPSITTVTNAVRAVDTSLNALTLSNTMVTAQNAYYNSMDRMLTETYSLQKAGVVFGPGQSTTQQSFAQSITTYGGQDLFGIGADTVLANLIITDFNGDQIRLAIAEANNQNTLATAGITVNNDPQPLSTYIQASSQGVPLKTYLSQNK